MDHLPELPLLLADVPATLRQALAQEGVPTAALRSGRAGKFVLFDSRRARPSLAHGQVAIDVHTLRAAPECDPLAALADERAACHEWQLDGFTVRETVSRVHRASVRCGLLADLRRQLEAAGGIWLRVSPYPSPYRSAFNFRLDHDNYVPEDFDATLAAITPYEHAVSHYVCAATHVRHPEALARLKGCHVGSHGWWHHTYREAGENLTNVRRGVDALRAVGIEPVGFAAPHGRFNGGLLAALEELGITHSSEFGLAYDDVPFFPRESDVLQIPVHPICLGICLEAARRASQRHSSSDTSWRKRPSPSATADPSRSAGATFVPPSSDGRVLFAGGITDNQAAEILLTHWHAAALQKYAAGEPMFFYGHADGRLGQHSWLLRDLLTDVSRFSGVWYTTLAAFEQWWRARAAIELTVTRTEQEIEITTRALPVTHRVSVDLFCGGEVANIELEGPRQRLRHDTLCWQPVPRVQASEVRQVAKSEGLRAGLRGYLDWERVTPIDEISARTWRGWAKRTLRRVRA